MTVRSYAALLVAILSAACGSARPPVITPTPPTAPQTYTLFVHVCDGTPCERDNEPHKVPTAQVELEVHGTVYVEHADGAGNLLVRDLVAGTRTVCAGGAPSGYKRACQAVTLPRPEAEGGQDVFLLLEDDVPPVVKVTIDGRFFSPRLVFAMEGSILAVPDEQRDGVLEELRGLGFNGLRTFAGDLGWANQTPAMAAERLPALFEAARARGLYVMPSALTGAGYNVEAHLRTIVRACEVVPNCVLEVANEVGHATQSDVAKDPARLLELARNVIPDSITWTLGAPTGQVDETNQQGTFPTTGGRFNDAHLNRDRDKWNMIRRLREIYGLAETFGVPAFSGEPIGAAEQSQSGRRESDPAVFFAMGALCRGFELGCVFHSEDGLHALPLGPNQRACAEAFIAGWRAIDTQERLQFLNAGWPGTPVRGANFESGVVRAYSFVTGNRGWTVLVGVTGDPRIEWGNGWRPVRTVGERPGVQLVEIAR